MTRVLVLQERYIPGYKSGGPVRSLQQLIAGLGGTINFSVLTTDRDTSDLGPYAGVTPGIWMQVRKAQVNYLPEDKRSHREIQLAVRQRPHDVLYLNGMFPLRFSIGPVVARALGKIPCNPIVIAPRGEFSPGALALKAPKKAAFLMVARASGFWQDAIWQASTENEVEDILRIMRPRANQVHVATDMISPLPDEMPTPVSRPVGAPLRVLFLSRLVPKKNLLFALQVLRTVTNPIHLSIVGPEEDKAYVRECRNAAALLPDHVQVTWQGAVQHQYINDVLVRHDLLFLPTWGENFGHVVAEAFSAGLPVLLSDTTPWRGLEALGIGYDLPLDGTKAFRDVLNAEAALGAAEALARRRAVFAYAKAREARSNDVLAYNALFGAAMAQGRLRQSADGASL